MTATPVRAAQLSYAVCRSTRCLDQAHRLDLGATVVVERVRDEHGTAEDEGQDHDRAHQPGRWTAVDAGAVNGRVTFAPGDEPAVDRDGGDERDRERERQRAPEQKGAKAGFQRTRNDDDDGVVD